MDRRIIAQKLESLRRCVLRIRERKPATDRELVSDYDKQDIIALNLERAIQQCIDIAAHVLSDYDDVHGQSAASLFVDLAQKGIISEDLARKIAAAAGFRNLLVHRYADIDWLRVYNAIEAGMIDLVRFSKDIEKSCLS